MAVAVLKRGSRGPEVKRLQEALNARLVPSPRLVPDGSFGQLTYQAAVRLQEANWLVVDGEAGQCTQNVAFQKETYTPILHTIPFIPQPTNSTCWAASTAMVNRSTVPAVIAKTPPDLILPDGSLKNFSETSDPMTGSRRFANAHNLTVVPPMSWLPVGLRNMLQDGPLIFDMLWSAADYVAGLGSSGHMIAVVGIRGDDDPSGVGTTLRIFDPWKPHVGKRYSEGYFKWMDEVPTRTYHIYHRK